MYIYGLVRHLRDKVRSLNLPESQSLKVGHIFHIHECVCGLSEEKTKAPQLNGIDGGVAIDGREAIKFKIHMIKFKIQMCQMLT